MFNTLLTDEKGNIEPNDNLLFLGRSGSNWCEPEPGEMIKIPLGASLTMMPERAPVGLDMKTERPDLCLKSSRGEKAVAVAALLPQGFTRTLLPATAAPQGSAHLPLLGYTAVGEMDGEIYAAAVQTDRHHNWHPKYYNTEALEKHVQKLTSRFPHNRILKQLAYCSLNYSCFTAQNIFYERWEGGIPTSPACNASCLGCISYEHAGVSSPQERVTFIPEVDEIVEVGFHHLEKAREGIISFGQGCEGEPSLQADRLAEAIKRIRQATDKGSINLNTNAGFTGGIKKMVDAGLDSMRVTLISAVPGDYNRYHCPRGYTLGDVVKSIAYAVDSGVYVSINLLTMPGYTDDEAQIEAILKLAENTGFHMLQLRNLNIDPDFFFTRLQPGQDCIGILRMIEVFKNNRLQVGSYTHPAKKGQGRLEQRKTPGA